MSKNNNLLNSKNPKAHKSTNSNSLNTGEICFNNKNLGSNSNELNTTAFLNNQPLNASNLNNNNSVQTGGVNQINQYGLFNKNYNMNSTLVENKNSVTEEIKSLQIKVDCVGKIPSARFGHTLVLISPVKLVLFGGAVGDTKNFQFSNETYVLNLMTKIWLKLEVNGNNIPCPRAAHSACSNENLQMVIYGGSTGSGMLAGDELHLFDLKNKEDEATWSVVPTTGKTPGKRYGHTLCYSKPHIILFGGNLGSQPANDTWILNLEKTTFSWVKIELNEESIPLPRLYHACGLCTKGNAQGMMIIFGGRDNTENALNDTWGLRRHRDGRWDWISAPSYKTEVPKPRYNHSMAFVGSLLIISGGRGRNIQELLSTEVYDTESSEWRKFSGVGLYRHSSFIKDNNLYLYGGFENSNPNIPAEKLIKIEMSMYFNSAQNIVNKIEETLALGKASYSSGRGSNSLDKDKENNYFRSNPNQNILLKNNNLTQIDTNTKPENVFRLANQAVVVRSADNYYDEIGPIMKVSIDKLNDEAKRIGYENIRSQVHPRRIYNEDIINKFIETLLRPFDWFSEEVEELHENLPFSYDEIDYLINEAAKLFTKDDTLIKIRSPAKIFGNLYGQYNDLMRFFESYGHPSDDNQMGDIHLLQYIFLGDFCSRGAKSLEVIFLLLALKVRYPDHIYIIRGHHEDISINSTHGLAVDCENRLDDNVRSENSIFMKLNALFEMLPLAVLIENKILCIHGGIGNSVSKLSDISSIRRPIQVVHDVHTTEQQILMDLLWSEYSDDINEVAVNEERDITKSGFILKYGKDRLNKFLTENKLSLVITSHQWISEGVRSFNNDKILTVFSATNYADKHNNIAGMLNVTKNPIQIIPKLIDVHKTNKKNYTCLKNLSPVRKNN